MNTTARALRAATQRLILAHKTLDEARRPCGTPLPAPQAWALMALLEAGPLSVTALADHLQIDRSNVSRLCARMESAGELSRAPDPHDGRARRLVLTPRGCQLAQQIDTASAAHFQTLLNRLGPRAAAVITALDTLTEAMTASPEPEEPR